MSKLKETIGGFVTAVRTLSMLPIVGQDAESMASSIPWFPVVGAILGLLVYALGFAISYVAKGVWPECAGFAAVLAGAYLTRGFHLDGLSDWADGYGSISDRQKILDIMKDSRVGVFGVLALILILLGKWIAITRLFRYDAGIWIVPAYIISRSSITDLIVRLPYARPGGGTASSVVTDSKPIHRYAALSLGVIITAALFGPIGLILFAVGLMVTLIFGRSCMRRLGGVTGDLLGANTELVETLMLFIAAELANGSLGMNDWHQFLK